MDTRRREMAIVERFWRRMEARDFYEVDGDRIKRAREYWVERRTQPTPARRAAWTEPISRARGASSGDDGAKR